MRDTETFSVSRETMMRALFDYPSVKKTLTRVAKARYLRLQVRMLLQSYSNAYTHSHSLSHTHELPPFFSSSLFSSFSQLRNRLMSRPNLVLSYPQLTPFARSLKLSPFFSSSLFSSFSPLRNRLMPR
jgi:hypothetical protein